MTANNVGQLDDEVVHNGLTGRPVVNANERFIMRKPVAATKKAARKSKAAMATLDGLAYIRGLVGKREFKIIPARMDEVGATKKVRHKGLKDLVEVGLIKIIAEPPGSAKTVRLLF